MSFLFSQDSEFILSQAADLFTRDYINECIKLVELVDDTRKRWKEASQEAESSKQRVKELEKENSNLKEYISVLSRLTNKGIKNGLETPKNCAPIHLPCFLTLSCNHANSDSSEPIKVDGMNVNTESPVRKRSSTRLSDEPNPKIRVEAAPLAAVEEYADKENSSVCDGIQDISGHFPDRTSDFFHGARNRADLRPSSSLRSSATYVINRRLSDIPFSEDELEQESPPQSEFIIRSKLRRSKSLNDVVDAAITPMRKPAEIVKSNALGSCIVSRPAPTIPTKSYQEAVIERPHKFVSRRVLVKLNCMSCHQPFRFGYEANRCKTCKWVCHPKCRDVTVMCIPFVEVPRAPDGRLKLIDYCTQFRPRLPHPVLRLVVGMENVLGARSLYIVNAKQDPVNALCSDAIYKKNILNMNESRPEVISGALLQFLSELRDPLILKTSFEEILAACTQDDDNELEYVIGELPTAHKNTLGFLCLHWHRILANSEVNGLTVLQLGTVISPILLRISPSSEMLHQCVDVFKRIMQIDQGWWERIIAEDSEEDVSVARSNSKKLDKLVRTTTLSQFSGITPKRNL